MTASNAGGSTDAQINITVAVLPVINFQYPASSYVFNQNAAITDQMPAYDGPVTSFSVSPSLPSGLSIHSTTGELSGTPTAITAATNYIVTATNSGGDAFDTLNIEVVGAAPCAGTRVGGFCWYFGSNNQSCTDVCSTHGGYHSATQTYAGSGGNNTQCGDVMTALSIISPTPVTATGSGTYAGMGCASDYSNNAFTIRSTATTTEGASSNGQSEFVRRACACQE